MLRGPHVRHPLFEVYQYLFSVLLQRTKIMYLCMSNIALLRYVLTSKDSGPL